MGTAQPLRGAAPLLGETARPFPSRSPRHGPGWAGEPRPPRSRLDGAGGSGVQQRGRPVPQVTVQQPPQNPTSVLAWLARQGPRVGPQEQLSLQLATSADRGSGTPEETSGGSAESGCTPGRECSSPRGAGATSPSLPSEPSALSPGKEEASPEKPGQGPRGQPCPFRRAYRHPSAPGRTGPQAGCEPSAAAMGPIHPIHGKILSVPEAKGQSWGCGPQPAQPPSAGWEPPVPPAPILNCRDGGRERWGA